MSLHGYCFLVLFLNSRLSFVKSVQLETKKELDVIFKDNSGLSA